MLTVTQIFMTKTSQHQYDIYRQWN